MYGVEGETKRVLTVLSTVRQHCDDAVMGLASGFSDGTVKYSTNAHDNGDGNYDSYRNLWVEHVLQEPSRSSPSITDIDGMMVGKDTVMVVCAT